MVYSHFSSIQMQIYLYSLDFSNILLVLSSKISQFGTIEKVNAIAKKFKIQNNIQAIFFDYLKFPSSQVANLKSVQEWQMLGYIASY